MPSQRAQVLVNDFVRSVYNWMGIGLALTAFVAFYVSSSESMTRFIFGNRMVFFMLILGELGLVFAISGMINKISAGTATFLFVLYSGLNGLTLSFIFLAYTRTSIASTFFVCAAGNGCGGSNNADPFGLAHSRRFLGAGTNHPDDRNVEFFL